MKNITTKSIHKKSSKKDGLRICVMRRIHFEYDFHIWIPELAPSETLLKRYVIKKEITWEDFSKQYIKTVLAKKTSISIISVLVWLAQSKKITLLCGEDSAKHCHRSLILNECVRQNKTK